MDVASRRVRPVIPFIRPIRLEDSKNWHVGVIQGILQSEPKQVDTISNHRNIYTNFRQAGIATSYCLSGFIFHMKLLSAIVSRHFDIQIERPLSLTHRIHSDLSTGHRVTT